ncbi:MAG: VanZ family protein [Oscillospiraceae bacterium]|jgi:glycopeptide antibiotics resistance protein|nr:VanZ family protein [Oscillospiraceae bacterium]
MSKGEKTKAADNTAKSVWRKAETIIILAVFVLYIMLMIRMLVISRLHVFSIIGGESIRTREVNLIPFRTVIEFISGRTESLRNFAVSNIAGNILLFIPLGAYVPLFGRNKGIARSLLIVLAASLLAEIIQIILAIGVADIDDLILNCLGGLIGFLIYKLAAKLFRGERGVRTAAAVVSAATTPFLLYLLFYMRMFY